jgi:hypothetical protein
MANMADEPLLEVLTALGFSSYLKTAESAEFAEKLKLTNFPSAVPAYSAVSFGIVC